MTLPQRLEKDSIVSQVKAALAYSYCAKSLNKFYTIWQSKRLRKNRQIILSSHYFEGEAKNVNNLKRHN